MSECACGGVNGNGMGRGGFMGNKEERERERE